MQALTGNLCAKEIPFAVEGNAVEAIEGSGGLLDFLFDVVFGGVFAAPDFHKISSGIDSNDLIAMAGGSVEVTIGSEAPSIEDIQAGAGQAEVFPFVQVAAFQVENLNATIPSIGHVKVIFVVQGEGVRGPEFAGFFSFPAPLLEELSVRGKLQDSVIGITIADKGESLGSPDHIGWLVELTGGIPGLVGRTQGLDQSSVRVVGEDGTSSGIRDPYVILRIDMQSMDVSGFLGKEQGRDLPRGRIARRGFSREIQAGVLPEVFAEDARFFRLNFLITHKPDEAALRIKKDHGMFSPVGHIDPAPGIRADGTDFSKLKGVGKGRPGRFQGKERASGWKGGHQQ